MISCLAWVRKGIAKANPEKVVPSSDDLKRIVEEARRNLDGIVEQTKTDTECMEIDDADKDVDIEKMYAMDDYDDENETIAVGGGVQVSEMSDLACYASNDDDPYVTVKEDIEDEDESITSGDNLIVAGRADGDMSTLDVFVYNDEESSLFAHHTILLSSFPLAVEWMDFDPRSGESDKANYVAVGTMEPEIGVWNLDVVESLEPVFTLGSKGRNSKSRKKKPSGGHGDAVMALSWSQITRNVLASGSADETIRLWDMARGNNTHCITDHKDKVQTLAWHPHLAHTLLSGSFDRSVRLHDSRDPTSKSKSWTLCGQIEKVAWDDSSANNFLASTDNGFVFGIDIRRTEPVFSFQAHSDAVTALCTSSIVPGCLVTGSDDRTLKVWDTKDGEPLHLLTKKLKVGPILCAAMAPDIPFVVATGGQKESLRVVTPPELATAREHFEGRLSIPVPAIDTRADSCESEEMFSSGGYAPPDVRTASSLRSAKPKGKLKGKKRVLSAKASRK